MSRVFAAAYDHVMAPSERACLAAWRADLLAGVRGEVLEVGAGTGANLPHYGAEVTRLVLAEPDRHMRGRLERRARARGVPVETSDASLHDLPWPDESFDWVVGTLVLCSVPDLERALREIRRVLRPGGALAFLEHVAAWDDPSRLRWQHRIEPLWRRVAGQCHVTRETDKAVESAGFTLERCDRASIRKALPFARPSVRGVARKGFSPVG